MITLRQWLQRSFPWHHIAFAAVWVFIFGYVWIAIDPRLIHHSLGLFTDYSAFVFSDRWAFLQEHLTRPAGSVELANGLLSQLFRYGWLGAFVLTGIAWALCRFAGMVVREAAGNPSVIIDYFPVGLVLAVYGQYHHLLGTLLAIIVGMSAVAIYLNLQRERRLHFLLLMLLMTTIAYYLAGAGSLVFPAVVASHELFVKRRVTNALLAVLIGLGIPFLVGCIRFGLPIAAAFGQFLWSDPGVTRTQVPFGIILCMFFVLVPMGSRVWRSIAGVRNSDGRSSPTATRRATAVWYCLGLFGGVRRGISGRSSSWEIAIAAVLLIVVAWLTLDLDTRTLIEIDRYAQLQDWREVLECAKRMPRRQFSARSNRNIISALVDTRRLGDEMFRHPQIIGVSPFDLPGSDRDFGALFQQSRLYLAAGQVNYAEKFGYDSLGIAGDLPEALDHLAGISRRQGRFGAARILLNSLSKNPFYRRRATELMHEMETCHYDDKTGANHRSSMGADADSFTRTVNIEEVLLAQCRADRRNRCAFEFLMAHYFLLGRTEKVVENIEQLREFDYHRIPRHYQEALVVYRATPGSRPLVREADVQPDVLREFELLGQILRRARDRHAAADEATAAGLGDTYFYFVSFGTSGS